MVTVFQLRDFNAPALGNAIRKWRLLGDALENAQRDAAARVAAHLRGSAWFGPAADGAYRNLDRLDDDMRHAVQQVRLVTTTLDAAYTTLEKAQRDLKALLATVPIEFFVHADGMVTYQTQQPSPTATSQLVEAAMAENRRRHGVAADIQGGVGVILRRANECDATIAATLRQLVVIAGTDTNLAGWQGAQQDAAAVAKVAGVDLAAIPRNDPVKAAAWWAGLTPEQQDAYLALEPKAIGLVDGLPADVRDQANRISLKIETSDLQRKIDADNASGRLTLSGPERQIIEKRLEGIYALTSKLDSQEDIAGRPGVYSPPAYLLAYDAVGEGRAVVALGNPDTAKHTAVFVPGTGADLTEVPGRINVARDLWTETQRYAAPGEVSTIMWLGYDPPNNPVSAAPHNVVDQGADPLRSFIHGVNASHQGAPAHTTIVAHSIGSTLVGVTAKDEPLPVQDIIVAGSPGMHVNQARELGLDPWHVWSGLADGESAVPGLGRITHGGDGMDAPIPSDYAFGANRFTTDGAQGHSDYWKQNESLRNQAAIIAGAYNSVELKWGSPPAELPR